MHVVLNLHASVIIHVFLYSKGVQTMIFEKDLNKFYRFGISWAQNVIH